MTIMSRQQGPKPIQNAVRRLRKALGETQEQFAHRLKTAVRTIARYEGERPPTGLVLAQLKQLADANDLQDVANVFHDAILRELGQDHIQNLGEFYSMTLTKPEEIRPVRALVEALRNPQYRQIADSDDVNGPFRRDVNKVGAQRRWYLNDASDYSHGQEFSVPSGDGGVGQGDGV